MDSRPVAVFRVFLGALLLKDALYHVPLARTFYSDQGILPRSALFSQPFGPFRFSLMDALGPPLLVAAFFLVWALVAAGLMVGYRARLAAVLNYLILVSVQYRNGYVLDGSDAVFRVLAFWAMFLPLSDHYAFDARRRRLRSQASGASEPAPPNTWALPLRLAQLQVALIYLATAAEKLRSGTWLGGDALFYTMQLKSLMLPLGEALFEAAPPALLAVGSVAVLLVEWAFPFLVLSPIGQPALRLVGLGLGVLLHGFIAVTMSISNFSLLMISSYWLFARGEWVEAIARRLRSTREPAELAGRVSLPVHVGARPPRAARAALGVLLVFLMGSVVWQNVWAVYYPLVPAVRGPALDALLYLALWQRWNMFVAGGQRADGWVEVEGVFEDGRVLDLLRARPPSDEMPRRHAGPWTRWKTLERAVDGFPPAHLSAWAWSACRDYAVPAPGRRLIQVELRHRFRMPHAPGDPPEPLQARVLWRQSCVVGGAAIHPQAAARPRSGT